MFSGIIEAQTRVLSASEKLGLIELVLEKPPSFDDLRRGDSVSHDGVCLTVENISPEAYSVTLAAETLRVTGWRLEQLLLKMFNVERSMKLSDRVHGHFVTGHVDTTAVCVQREDRAGSLLLNFKVQNLFAPMFWRKGSVAVNGVSLTVNDVTDRHFEVCLIPETRLRTNLETIGIGDVVLIEFDQMARAIHRMRTLYLEQKNTNGDLSEYEQILRRDVLEKKGEL